MFARTPGRPHVAEGEGVLGGPRVRARPRENQDQHSSRRALSPSSSKCVAIRFRKSFKLAPGVRWNISGSGSSWTLGPRGATLGIGKRGAYLNSSIPGTGLSSRSRLSGPAEGARPLGDRASTAPTAVSMTCAITEDGSLVFSNKDGSPVPEQLVEVAKKQNRAAILDLIQRKCDEINDQIEALGRLHHDTPAPKRPTFEAPTFSEPPPPVPTARGVGLVDRLIPGREREIAEENRSAAALFESDTAAWKAEKARFDRRVADRRFFIESLIHTDLSAMERFLEESLQEVVWPRETTVAFDILDAGQRVMLDVDLPELEDMPVRLAAVPARGLKLSVKELSATRVQKLYAEHVHGILFRLVGEVFAALPAAQEVMTAGYSQRRDPATAELKDDYLLSVRVLRTDWARTDFAHLAAVDAAEALSRFDLRREMLKSGALKTIEPHVLGNGQ